jgi:5-methylcytosine-specific restriction endonuclease McrA
MKKVLKKDKDVEKKEKKWVLRPLMISALKKLFVRSPMFRIIKKMNRRPRTVINKDGSDSIALRWEYQCNICKNWFPEKIKKEAQIQIDHIDPVINPETGFINIDDWSQREFIGVECYDPKTESEEMFYTRIKDKLQIACLKCHVAKSIEENARRREVKKLKAPPKNTLTLPKKKPKN